MPDEPQAAQNTDRELWRERDGDYYADSIHVTANGGIGINVGGHVIVMTLQRWHELADGSARPAQDALRAEQYRYALMEARGVISKALLTND